MSLLPHEKHAIRFMVRHLIYGSIGGFTFGVLALIMDIGGIRSMAFSSPQPWLPIMMLFFGLFITFGSAGMAVGVMSEAEDKN